MTYQTHLKFCPKSFIFSHLNLFHKILAGHPICCDWCTSGKNTLSNVTPGSQGWEEQTSLDGALAALKAIKQRLQKLLQGGHTVWRPGCPSLSQRCLQHPEHWAYNRMGCTGARLQGLRLCLLLPSLFPSADSDGTCHPDIISHDGNWVLGSDQKVFF